MKKIVQGLIGIIGLFWCFASGQELLLSEVFFDGSDERIEILNIGQESYQGEITLKGAKSSDLILSVDIQPGEVLLIGDKGDHIIDKQSLAIRDQGLSLTDTKGIDIQLIINEQVVSTIIIHTGDVDNANNQKASFQRIFDTQDIVVTSDDDSYNVQDEYTANPGRVLLSDGSLRELDVGGDGQTGEVQTGTNSGTPGQDTGSGEQDTSTGAVSGTGSGETTTGSTETGDNIGSGEWMSTGSISTGSQTTTGDVQTGTVNSGGANHSPESSHHQLILSEVFVDGSDERVEITNVGTGMFSGTLELKGAKSTTIQWQSILVPPGETVLFADQADMVRDQTKVIQKGIGLSMTDTKELYLSLYANGKFVDYFAVSEESIKRFDNQKRSFEKILYQGVWITTFVTSGRVENVYDGFFANPGTLQIAEGDVEQLLSTNIVHLCPSQDAPLVISEVHREGGGLPYYLEIYGRDAYQGNIILSGTLLSGLMSDAITVNIDKDEHIIIAGSKEGFIAETRVLTADIYWGSSGQLLIYGQSGQLLDNIYIKSHEEGISSYTEKSRQACVMYFDHKDLPTPGLSQDFVNYFSLPSHDTTTNNDFAGCAPTPTFVDISIRGLIAKPKQGDESIILHMNRGPQAINLAGYYLMIGGRKRYLQGQLNHHQTENIYQNFGFPNDRGECISIHDPQGEQLDDICYTTQQVEGLFLDMSLVTDDQPSQTQDQLVPDISIVGVEYDPPGRDSVNEIVHVQNNNERKYDKKELWLQVGDRSTKTYIYHTLRSQEEKHFEGNYRLPNNKPTCVSLMYQSTLLDTHCYDPQQDKKTQKNYQRKTITRSNSIQNIDIKITDIIFDPEGQDKDNESITLQLTKGESVDLSDFYLLIGTRKKSLKGILKKDKPITITKTWGLHNTRQTCLTLMHQDDVYDQYCYDPQAKQQQTNAQLLDAELVITNLVYDPKGKDEGNEIIVIKNESEQKQNLADITLSVDNKKKSIEGSIDPGEEKTFKANFAFPNKGACVMLSYQDHVYDTWCYGDKVRHGKYPQQDMTAKLTILELDYDPPGSDTNHESLTVLWEGTEQISLDEAYIQINERKRQLKGHLEPGLVTTRTDNYRFPNDGACIQLYLHDELQQEYCYGSAKKHSQQHATIERLLPNPVGADADNEKVLVSVLPHVDPSQIELLVNKQKKETKRTRIDPTQYVLSGKLGLSNKVGCVSLRYQHTIIDHRCYYANGEGKRVQRQTDQLSLASSDQARILNNIALSDQGDRYCISREGTRFDCKEKKVKAKSIDSFYRSYISTMHNYLYQQWPVLYYQSDIALYRQWYNQAEDQMRSGKSSLQINGSEYTTTNFRTIAEEQRPRSYYDWILKKLKQIEQQNL